MSASRSDMFILQTDPTFGNRVRSSMIAAAISISNEGIAVAFHKERSRYAAQILNGPDNFKPLFAASVATDTNVIGDATSGGTVVLTAGNVAAQAGLVSDGHIDAAISSEFNSFIQLL